MRAVATNQSLTETAYETLRADLLSCRLAPGDKLNINELAGRLGVSLGAVREALSRLTAEDLVRLEAHRGFRVASVSASELHDLTSTRIEVETACLRRAIAHGDLEWEAAIVAAFHRLSRLSELAPGTEAQLNDEWVRAHKEFHRALVAACDSPWRLRLRDYLYDQTERYRRLSVPASLRGERRDLASEHRAIMEATLARDSARAVTLVEQHLAVTASLVATLAERAPGETPADAPRQARRRGPGRAA